MKKIDKEGNLQEITKEEIIEKFKEQPLGKDEEKELHEIEVVLKCKIPNTNMVWLLSHGTQKEEFFMMFGWCRITEGEFGYVTLEELMNESSIIIDESEELRTLEEMIKKEEGVIY